ncbi:hypothetical protein ScPMuIL_019002 [Solemya velum]
MTSSVQVSMKAHHIHTKQGNPIDILKPAGVQADLLILGQAKVEDERVYPTEQQPPIGPKGILFNDKERKKKEKEEKEKLKKEREEEKRRMKEEAKRRKAEEKERKAAEKAKKGKKNKEKDWDEAVAVAVTTDGKEVPEDNRHSDRLRSFEEDDKLDSEHEHGHEQEHEELEGNERAIDVAIQPLSESTPIKESPVEAEVESPESSPEKEVVMEETQDKENEGLENRGHVEEEMEIKSPVRELSM